MTSTVLPRCGPYDHLFVDALLERGDVGDDAHEAVALGEAGEDPDGLLEALVVQRAEAFIEEEVSSRMPPAALWTSSERPRASASEALKLSPPERVLTLRRVLL